MAPDTAARRNGGYESGDGPLPADESLPTGPAPGAQKATATAALPIACRKCDGGPVVPGTGLCRECIGPVTPTTTAAWPGQTANSAYSHVLCHAEVKRRTRQARLFAALYLYALAVAVIVLWVR